MTAPTDRFSEYVEEDAERWIDVHERIAGLTITLMAVTDAAIERDPEIRPRIIVRLQEAIQFCVADQKHPSRTRELRRFLLGLGGEDPTREPTPPKGGAG